MQVEKNIYFLYKVPENVLQLEANSLPQTKAASFPYAEGMTLMNKSNKVIPIKKSAS